MKKLALSIITLILLMTVVHGQQNPLYTQFMFNPYVINPAVAGTNPYYQIRTIHRFQWIGFTGAPTTNTLSFYGPIQKQPMGVGGYVFSDVTGSESKTGVYGSYAYNYAINDEIKISMGITAGVLQYKLDGTKLSLSQQDDPVANFNVESKFIPDASIGVYLWATTFQVGFAATQLINNKLNFGDDPTGLNKLRSHFYLTAGYKYFINRDWAIEPTIILKEVYPTPPQLDFSTRVIYQNMVWLGFAYRTADAISTLIGYSYENKIYFGVAYDLGINDIGQYNNGSVEIMLGFKFDELRL